MADLIPHRETGGNAAGIPPTVPELLSRIAALEARLAIPWRVCPECGGHCTDPDVRCFGCALGAECPDDARCPTCHGAGAVPPEVPCTP